MQLLFKITSLIFILAITSYAENSALLEITNKFHKLSKEELKEQKSDICFNCHLASLNSDSAEGTWFSAKKSIKGTIKNLDDSNGVPDSFSKACLICHDGGEASIVMNAPISPCGIKSNKEVGSNGKNHPVFMTYAKKIDLHDSYDKLTGLWTEAEQVSDLLREGKIVCISCHTPHHNKEVDYLRTSTKGSALCLGCHKK